MGIEGVGPELVIAGAARSGTSFLAAQLGAHPNIDPGSLKEPNFYSRHQDRGVAWYDSLFLPREPGLLRLDASVSYTYPQYPAALPALAVDAPGAYLVYVVRDPVPRAVSHYLYYRHYFKQEPADNFGAALNRNDLYAGASDYQRRLSDLHAAFPAERVLLVPFRAVTDAGAEVTTQVCRALGLPPPELDPAASSHQNNVVAFRHPVLRFASRRLRRSRFYPVVRDRLGAARLRRMRSVVTKETSLPTFHEALSSCTPEQLEQLRELEQRGHTAVSHALREQDARLGLGWAGHWTEPASLPNGEAGAR